MNILRFLKKSESLLAIDIGSRGVRILDTQLQGGALQIVNFAYEPFSTEVFTGHQLENPTVVSEAIVQALETGAISDKRVAIALPGPSVFTKRVRLNPMSVKELTENIAFEAANFIPYSIDAVKIDFHVFGFTEDGMLDVLVVAVKNEVIDSYMESLSLAGLQTAVVDVDHFATQNMVEICYPEYRDSTVAIINIGSRFSSMNICYGGGSLFTGDIQVGGSTISDSIAEELSISFKEAEDLKLGLVKVEEQAELVRDITERSVEYMATELNRQLSFFWNATGSEGGIDRILLTGGGAMTSGLTDEISERTGIVCEKINCLRGIGISPDVDSAMIHKFEPVLGMCIGLATRQPGDRIVPEGVEVGA